MVLTETGRILTTILCVCRKLGVLGALVKLKKNSRILLSVLNDNI